MPKAEMERLREEAKARFDPEKVEGIYGSDIDPEAVELARRHLAQAGLRDACRSRFATCGTFSLTRRGAHSCSTRHTGERLSDRKACEALYRDLGLLSRRYPGFHLACITSHPGFERCYGPQGRTKSGVFTTAAWNVSS